MTGRSTGATDKFRTVIKNYLETRGSNDPIFARIITKKGKNMDECISYIIETVRKSGISGFTDDEVYSMAIHYFDEDDLTVTPVNDNVRVVVNHKVELTEEEKQIAREKAMEELKNEIKAKARRKPNPAKTIDPPISEEAIANEHSGSKSAEQTLF